MKDKRILAFLLALVMCLSLLPVTAFAEEDVAEAPAEEAVEEVAEEAAEEEIVVEGDLA